MIETGASCFDLFWNRPVVLLSFQHMERIVNKVHNFAAADEWDIHQQMELSAQERQRIARELKRRVYGTHTLDVRACHPRK